MLNAMVSTKKNSMRRSERRSERVAFVAAIIIGIFVILPLLMLVNLTFKTYEGFLANPIAPVTAKTFTLSNYKEVWQELDFFKNTFNTLFYTVLACIINVTVVVLAAYPLGRRHFKGSKMFVSLMMASMLLPTTMVATIFILKDIFNIYATPMALLYVWTIGGVQFNIFMAIGFVNQIPRDLDDAAFIDGCGYFRCIFKIMLPLIKPVIATIVIFKAVSCWNDFMTPYIYAGSSIKTLSTGLFMYKGQFVNRWNLLSTAVLIVALPMVIIYCFCQKWIIAGLTSGAVKG